MMNKGAFYVLLCYILWGLLPVFWKLLSEVSSVYVLASRILWSMVFCFIIIILKKDLPALNTVFKDRRQLFLMLLSGIMITVNWGVYIYAVNSGHILEGSLAYYINPIISVLMGFFVFKERLRPMQWISVFTAAAGVLFSVVLYGSIPIFSLLIGGSFAVYSAVKKNVKVQGEISTFTETLFMTLPALAVIAFMEYNEIGAVGVLPAEKLFLLPLAGVVTSIPLLLFSAGIKSTPMSLSGIIMYVNPTLQLLVGVIIYKEEFKPADAVTFAAVWLALILFVISDIRANMLNKETASEN